MNINLRIPIRKVLYLVTPPDVFSCVFHVYILLLVGSLSNILLNKKKNRRNFPARIQRKPIKQ